MISIIDFRSWLNRILLHLSGFAIIAVAGLLIYSNTFHSEFHFDDLNIIHKSSVIKDLNNFKTLSYWTNFNSRPLANFTFALNYHWGKLDEFGYHVVNLIIHIVMGCFVYLLVQVIGSIIFRFNDVNSGQKYLIALFTALICITHPLQTQAVTYIVQRMASLTAMFYISAVYFYAKGRLSHVEKGIKLSSVLWYISAFTAGISGSLVKQNSATFPLAFLLFELCFIRSRKQTLYIKYLIISFSVLVLGFMFVLIIGKLPVGDHKDLSRFGYLTAQFCVLVKYLKLLILPTSLNVDYDYPYPESFWNLWVIMSLSLLSVIIAAGVKLFEKYRIITFGIVWFFLTISVESSIIPINDVIFEHRLYLPMLGFGLILVTFVRSLCPTKNRFIFVTILSSIIVAYGIASHARNRLWKTELSLWTDVVNKSPNKARPLYNLALTYKKKGQNDLAINYFERSYKADPLDDKTLNHLGSLWNNKGNKTKGIQYLEKALNIKPNEVDILFNLGNAWRDKDTEKAINYYQRIIKISPNYTDALNNLGTLHQRLKQTDKARHYFLEVLKRKSGLLETLYNLANLEVGEGNNYLAAGYYERFLKKRPKDISAMEILAYTYISLKRYKEAEEIYLKVIKLTSGSASTYMNLLKVYDCQNEYAKAFPFAVEAGKRFPDNKQLKKNIATIFQKFKQKNDSKGL